MKNPTSRDEAWYRELKGRLKTFGIKDSDELFAAKSSMLRHMKHMKLCGILMIILGVPTSLFVIGIPILLTGFGALIWANKTSKRLEWGFGRMESEGLA